MEDHGRSGLRKKHKKLFLSKKNRGASLERQAIAPDSQITKLRSANITASDVPIKSSPDVKLDPAFISILEKKVHLLVDAENGLSRSLARIKHLEEQIQQKSSLKI